MPNTTIPRSQWESLLLLLGAQQGGVRVVLLPLHRDPLVVLAQGHVAELLLRVSRQPEKMITIIEHTVK